MILRPGARLLGWAASVLACVAVTACAKGVPPPPEITVLVPADVTGETGIYPYVRNESFTAAVSANIFEGVVRFDDHLGIEPAVALTWESPDDRTWEFQLRPGLRFSDGSPVRAADVAASIDLARGPGSAYRAMMDAVESAEAVSETRVRVRTRTPYPVLLPQITAAFVLPKAEVDRRPARPIGTGPWRLESRVPGRELVLVPNPAYREGPPPWSKLRFVVEPDAAARVRAVAARSAQVADAIPLSELPRLRGRTDVRLVSRSGLRVLFLALRTDEPPFSDPRVREALDLALDRDELIHRALGGAGVPASQIVPPAVLGYDPALQVTRPDRERARRLLREAGREGLTFTVDGPINRYAGDVAILDEVARQLALVGVQAQTRTRPKEEFFRALSSRLQAYLLGWSCEPLHAGDALGTLVHTPNGAGLGTENSNGWSDPELDRMIEEADHASSLERRKSLLARALGAVARKRPVLPLLIQVESMVLAPGLAWDPPDDMGLRFTSFRHTRP